MPSFICKIAAALAICSTSSAHIILSNPTPYSADSLTNSPLTSSQYPCQISGDAATFYSTDGVSNEATAGDSVSMSFKGSAVHGGGSCQVALSTDMQPSTTTRWSVILSVEGGCPTKDGTSTGTYDVKIPSDIPAGTYSYAWTWTSKMSGTQEYYMNCAPITIKAASGSKKRSTNLRARADALDNYPPLAVYNLADLNSCKSVLSSDPKYPFPGDNVEHDLASGSYAYEDITGDSCFAKGVTYDGSSSGGSSSSDSGSDSGSATSSASSGSSTGSTGSDSGSGSAAGGVFATSSAAAPAATATGSSSGSDSGSSGSDSGSDSSGSAATSTASSSGSASTGSASTGSSGSSSSGSCTAGDYECATDGSSYKMCVAGGEWSTSMAVAAGTTCTPGTSTSLAIAAVAVNKRSFVQF